MLSVNEASNIVIGAAAVVQALLAFALWKVSQALHGLELDRTKREKEENCV